MAFTPVSIPIQEILLSDFVTDIASISNTNDLLLKDKIEDLINVLEIDLNTISIDTSNKDTSNKDVMKNELKNFLKKQMNTSNAM